ncbi:hypothetical protein M514_03555 [Trichuris suis]|uniref:Uncharacterized protein n=1 Tax=Trichuris suis TaxID=68888 RepID=A0A085ME57_9BILA|nr:hypothetical protein M513_03555 [Trichuris suis]KFD71305.1 hypothetical protein M514_03555 [Trichuris suis]KHJ48340.1 hypothetical protein D918_01611 [Trichuris suis]
MEIENSTSGAVSVNESIRGQFAKEKRCSSASLRKDDLIKHLKCNNAILTRSCWKAKKKIHQLRNECLEMKRQRDELEQRASSRGGLEREVERLQEDLKTLQKENAQLKQLLLKRREACHTECNKHHKEALSRFASSILEKLRAVSYVESLVTHSLNALCDAYEQVNGPLNQISSFCDVIEEISSKQGPSSSSQSSTSEPFSIDNNAGTAPTDIGPIQHGKDVSDCRPHAAKRSAVTGGMPVVKERKKVVNKKLDCLPGKSHPDRKRNHSTIKKLVIADNRAIRGTKGPESKCSIRMPEAKQSAAIEHDTYSFVGELSECNVVAEQPKRNKQKRIHKVETNPVPAVVPDTGRSAVYGLRPRKRISYIFS